MKKRYTLVAIASIMLLSSIALMINKNSFAEPNYSNQCFDQIELVIENKEKSMQKMKIIELTYHMVDSIGNQKQRSNQMIIVCL